MKVAFILGSLNRGGAESLILDILKSTRLQFIGIHRKGGDYKSDFYNTNHNFYECNLKKTNLNLYLKTVRNILKKENVDIVHVHQYIDVLLTKLSIIFTNIKLVTTKHGYDFKLSFFQKLLVYIGFIISDKVLFVSYAQKDYYLKKYKIKDSDKYQVVYNGINFEKLDVEPIKLDLPTKHVPTQRGMKLAMVGNFVPGRSQNTVCQFAHLLRKNDFKFDLYFIGKKSDAEPWRYDNCVRYCEENNLTDFVHFLGGRGDVPQILNNIDAFIYSTDHDTFGIAVIEAIAAGVPTFVNDWVVMNEVCNNGRWATIYRTKDAEDLLDKFMDFTKNVDIYKSIAKKNAIAVRSAYSIETHINNIKRIYNSL